MKQIFIIAGEASGDQHGAALMREIRTQRADVQFVGIGGPSMRQEGLEMLVNASSLSVVGITEVFSRLPDILKGLRLTKHTLRSRSPDLVILIDFPDFNFLVAGYAKRLRLPVLYYISPQLWAWRASRVHQIRRLVDRMAVILPFEEAFYRKYKVPVTFVGHPLTDGIPQKERVYNPPAPDIPPVIGLLPGSRKGEIHALLPVMLEAVGGLKNVFPDLRILISRAPTIAQRHLEAIVARYMPEALGSIVTGDVYEVLSQTHLIMAASGTVTLQAAIAGTPMVVIYKVSPISYTLGRALIRVRYISLVNLIYGGPLVPELIQDHANPETLAETVGRLLNDPEALWRMHQKLVGIQKKLGGAGASRKVASMALEMITND